MTARAYPTPSEVAADAGRQLARYARGAAGRHDAPPASARQPITPSQPRQAVKPALTQRAPITPDPVGDRILVLLDQGLSDIEATHLAEAEATAGTLTRPGVTWRERDEWGRPMAWGPPDPPSASQGRGRHWVTLGGHGAVGGPSPLPAMRWSERVAVVETKRGER